MIGAFGAMGFVAYEHKYYQAKLQAKFDRHFGTVSLKQKLAQEEKIDTEVDSLLESLGKDCKKQYKTTGQPGPILGHLKDLRARGLEGVTTAAVEKMQEQKNKKMDEYRNCVCKKFWQLENARRLARDGRDDVNE